MKKVKKYSIEKLKEVYPFVSNYEANELRGGYTYASGYYVFLREELEGYFSDGSIPAVFGDPVFELVEESEGIQSYMWVYHVSLSLFNTYIANNEQGDGNGSASGSEEVGELNNDWPYTGTPNEGYHLNTNQPIGTYYNPYSYAQYQEMLTNATWNGGYVAGTAGFVTTNNLIFPERVLCEEITYNDLNSPNSGWLAMGDRISEYMLTSIPILGTAIEYIMERHALMMEDIKNDITQSSYVGNSRIYITHGWPVVNNDITQIKVYNAETGDLITGYTMDIYGNYHRSY